MSQATQPTMPFSQIMAMQVPGIVVPPQPQTNANRPSDTLLLKDTIPPAGSPVNRGVLYKLITSGALSDPAPHYALSEADLLITWLKEMLTVRLNFLLEREASCRGQPQKCKVKNLQPSDPMWKRLANFFRMKRRAALMLRSFEDWKPVLSALDLDPRAELRITDLVILVSEAHRRVDELAQSAARAIPVPQSALVQLAKAQHLQMANGSMPTSTGISQQPSPAYTQAFPGGGHNVPQPTAPMQSHSFIQYVPPNTSNVAKRAPMTQDSTGKMATGSGQVPSVQSSFHVGNWDHHLTLGKRKASRNCEDAAEAIKMARRETPSRFLTPTKQSYALSTTPSPPVKLPNFLNGSPDYRSYMKALATDFSQRPATFSGGETIVTQLPPDPSDKATNYLLSNHLGPIDAQIPPFRLMGAPAATNCSLAAQCIRFAKLESQENVEWRAHHGHVQEIEKRSDWYGMELLRSRTNIAFGFDDEYHMRLEFDAVLCMRYAQMHPNEDHVASSIGSMCEVFETHWEPADVMRLLTDQDKTRFPVQIAAWEARRTTALALAVGSAEVE